MSAPPFPAPPAYPPVPPPPPSQAPSSSYYNPYTQYPGFPPAAPQPYDSYIPPRYDQNHPHNPHSHHSHHNHNQGQSSSSQRAMYPRPVYSIPAKISNAIYIKNLPYDLSFDEFISIFSKFGEIASHFTNKISTRGFAFVTYYDIRSAINAIEQMKDQKVHNRQPVAMFSFNPPEYSRLNPHETSSMILVKPIENNTVNLSSTDNQTQLQTPNQTSDQQQSSTFNSFFGSTQNIALDSDSVAKALSSFGEIYKTSELGNQFVVQYYDFRSAQNAIASSDQISINNQKVILESYVEPDEGVYYENAPPGYNPQSQMQPIPPPGMPVYPPPYQDGGSPQQHLNNGGGNRNNRNNRHGNHPQQSPINHHPFQPPPLPPSYIQPTPQPVPPQIPSQQQPLAPPSMPPQYSMPPPSSQYQQGNPPMQYMMQYPQTIPPPPSPSQQ